METIENKQVDFDRLWNYNKPDETEQRFRELLPEAQQHTPYYIELLTQIARTQGLQRKFDAAHITLNEAKCLLNDDTKRAHIRYLLERGRVFNSSKYPDQARPPFVEAWERALAAGEDNLAVDAAHMIAIVESPEAQMEWNLKALDLAEQSDNKQAQHWRGSLYNNIGWAYHSLGQYEQALDIFQKAVTWQEGDGNVSMIRIAKWCVARTLRSLDRIEEALGMQQKLLEEITSIGESDGYVYEELAECLLLLNRSDKARKYFALAYRELSKDHWLVEREPARIERLKEIGQVV